MLRRSPLWSDPRVQPRFGEAELDGAHPLAAGLVGCWLLNEGGGLAAMDLGPYRNIGVLENGPPIWTAYAAGIGAKFTGGTRINLGAPTSLRTQILTINARIALSGSTGDRAIIGGATVNGDLEFRVDTTTNTVSLISQSQFGIGTSTAGLVAGPAVNVCVTWNNVTGAWAMYFDGVLAGSGTTINSINYVNGQWIGASAATNGTENFEGVIGHVQWWNVVLPGGAAAWLAAEPYAMLRPVIRRRYFVPVVVGAGYDFHHYYA